MRIDVTFKDFQTKATSHRTLSVVETFVNDGLGDRYYGPGMTWIDISVQSHAKTGRKLKRNRKYRGSFAEHVLHEVNAEFSPTGELSLDDFRAALALIETCISDSSDCWYGDFRLNTFRQDFRELARFAPASADQLDEYAETVPSLKDQITLKWLRSEEQHRFENPRPREHKLRGMRCYPSGRLERELGSNAAAYCKLFEGLLRAAGWMTPGYAEIYVNLDETDELARLSRSAVESWHENAYAVIHLEQFEASNPETKDAMLFEAFSTALRELAEIDHLDREVLESAIAQIASTGFATDLIYLRKENDAHAARIVYRLEPDSRTPIFRLKVTEKSTGKIVERQLEVRADEELYLAYRFGQLELTKQEVRIRARKGDRAEVFLKRHKRPRVMIFELRELFANP